MNEAEYVVVGAGSAGCVAAATLARAGHSVLLLEDGQRAEDNPETLSADGYKEAFVNDRLMHERFTVPQVGCGGRRLFAGTGRGVGGSGAINAMVYTRGAREDLDAWGEGWRWDDVAADFEEVERRLRPNRRAPTRFTRACIQAAREQHMREKDDLNDGDLENVLGHEWMNYEGDRRRSAYVAFIRDEPPPSLTTRTGVRARSIEIDEQGRARSVVCDVDGRREAFSATREVLVAAGALATPAILLASGVGPYDVLDEAGVSQRVELPGVGKNLHDHPNVTLFFLGHDAIDAHYPQLYGFGRMRHGQGPSDSCFVFYPARSSFREGLIRMLPAMTLPEGAYRRGRAKRWMRGAISTAFRPGLVRGFVERMWGIVVVLGKPASRGELTLGRAGDAVIDPRYLADGDDLDVMISGVRHARRIAAGAPLAEIGSRELIPGALGLAKSDDPRAIEAFLKKNLMTTYHFAGTCKMGDDRLSVVDRRLRVRGVRGLRVVDASIIPEAPVAALNAPSMMIGLRGAKMALADRSREG